MSGDDDYGLSPNKEIVEIDAPEVDYRPAMPRSYRPKIAMIGTGGISEFHLKAYRKCCLLYTSPSPRDVEESRMPSSA